MHFSTISCDCIKISQVEDGTLTPEAMYGRVKALLHISEPLIETERLRLYPLGNTAMRDLIAAENDPDMKQAYTEMLDGCLSHPLERVWNAVWTMEMKNEPAVTVGDFCFKGLGSDGTVEIGYGLKPGFCHRGYMTEAVCAAVRWALSQPGIVQVEAETEESNTASRSVLLRAGFVPTGITGAEGPRYCFRLAQTISM